MDHSKLKTRDSVFWMEVYQRLSKFAHTQMEKVWSRIILVHNNFFLSYSKFACFNVLVLCYYFFFNFRIISLVNSVDSVGTTIFTLPMVISSLIFYTGSYQFDVCLFSNVKSRFLVFFSTL